MPLDHGSTKPSQLKLCSLSEQQFHAWFSSRSSFVSKLNYSSAAVSFYLPFPRLHANERLAKQNPASGLCKRAKHGPIWACTFTSLTGAWPVASSSAIAYESIPAFFADTSVLARVAFTLLARLLVAWGFDAGTVLRFSNLTDVFASTVNEKVTDTAHIAVVEHRCPELSGQDEVGAVSGKPTQVHVTLQVQNLTLTTSCERGPSAVYRDGACGGDGESRDQDMAALMQEKIVISGRNHAISKMDGRDTLLFSLVSFW